MGRETATCGDKIHLIFLIFQTVRRPNKILENNATSFIIGRFFLSHFKMTKMRNFNDFLLKINFSSNFTIKIVEIT